MMKFKTDITDRYEGYIIKHVHFVGSEYLSSRRSDRFHIEHALCGSMSASGKYINFYFGIDKRMGKAAGSTLLASSRNIGDSV